MREIRVDSPHLFLHSVFSIDASPAHPGGGGGGGMLIRVWFYTVEFVLGSEPYVTILHRECYRTLRYGHQGLSLYPARAARAG